MSRNAHFYVLYYAPLRPIEWFLRRGNERNNKMTYYNEDRTISSSYNYDPGRYDCQPYAPPQTEYDCGYDAGKMAVGIGAGVLGAALVYFIMKNLNEK